MQDLDPTQYGEADAGGRRRAERLLVREYCRSWLSKIICGVMFYETLCKADVRLRRVPLTPHPRRPYVRTFVCPSRARLSVRHLVLRGRS
jgi:hypothetical protein